MQGRILVVGAGICGLALAAEVSRKRPTAVIDRLPVIGGITAGYENATAIALANECNANGVEFLLGTTALRWSQGRLLVAGPIGGIRWLEALHFVYAGGSRPSTAAELRLVGDRLSGVLPAMVAYHLLEAGVCVGHAPVVIGSGRWAERICKPLATQGSRTTVVVPNSPSRHLTFGTACWIGWSPASLHGSGRVTALQVERSGVQQTIVCDAVILAGVLRPMRNVDGAVFDDAEDNGVSYAQLPSETATYVDLSDHGRLTAAKVLAKLEGE
jgi:hypothetical protein